MQSIFEKVAVTNAQAGDANPGNVDDDVRVLHGGAGACATLSLAHRPHVRVHDGHHWYADADLVSVALP